ncbi:trypsin-like peptidase domain-containing protein [Frondihabitans sp. Leaf304]|uniref:trypsin-like peptidase domain-containing protein n=1 Tax=Frondihabitans sp. Leaf304 TaxID=1736329 RepID=UPI003FA4D1E3
MSVQISAIRTLPTGGHKCVIAGTGFLVSHEDDMYLVTNGHIVTGRHRLTDNYLGLPALPDFLEATFPISGVPLGETGSSPIGTRTQNIPLYDEKDRSLWLVDPRFGRRTDVVAIPLSGLHKQRLTPQVPTLIPYSMADSVPVSDLEPAQDISVVGFPFGLTAGARSAIWVRGTVASEPWAGFEGDACFLIDARTREGQSGSPCIVPRSSEEGAAAADEIPWRLVGIYSGRTDSASDLGRVWPVSVLSTILDVRSRDKMQLI